MVIALSDSCMAALKSWAERETWHTTHALDEELFFEFVGRYVTDHGYTLNEQALQDAITEIAGIGDRQDLKDIAYERVTLMQHILDFMRVTGRR